MWLIRADANTKVGMGHLMRCLSIADAARGKNIEVRFVIADSSAADVISSRGYDYIILDSDYQEMDAELDAWQSMNLDLCDVVLVDSYYISYTYLSGLKHCLRESICLIYVDDVAAFPYPVDTLLNYNAYASNTKYASLYADSGECVPHLLLGERYVPLRAMFQNVPRRMQKKQVTDVLISTGGADGLHVMLSFLQYIMQHALVPKYKFHLLIGNMNSDREAIIELSRKMNIDVHERVEDMRGLIEACDIVVTAAGSTMYEICACGVPMITFSTADNQINGTKVFEESGLAISIGDLRNADKINHGEVFSGSLSEDAPKRILNAIDELSQDYVLRQKMGSKMQNLIDGHGADRIVSAILDV